MRREKGGGTADHGPLTVEVFDGFGGGSRHGWRSVRSAGTCRDSTDVVEIEKVLYYSFADMNRGNKGAPMCSGSDRRLSAAARHVAALLLRGFCLCNGGCGYI